LYPGQKPAEHHTHRPEIDSKPFIVPGGGISVWPNGTVNGPWLTKTVPTFPPIRPSFVPFTSTPKIETLSTKHAFTQVTNQHKMESYQTLGTPTKSHSSTIMHTTTVRPHIQCKLIFKVKNCSINLKSKF
jgi:hypothetical protein